MVLAASNVLSEARREVKCDRTISKLSESARASRLEGKDARERRLLISVGDVSVSAPPAVDEKRPED